MFGSNGKDVLILPQQIYGFYCSKLRFTCKISRPKYMKCTLILCWVGSVIIPIALYFWYYWGRVIKASLFSSYGYLALAVRFKRTSILQSYQHIYYDISRMRGLIFTEGPVSVWKMLLKLLKHVIKS